MNKTKLEIIRLVNSDVIATSATTCKNAKGVAWYDSGWHFSLNNDQFSGAQGANIPGGINPDINKLYHTDENGNILNEVCPCTDHDAASSEDNHNCCLAAGTMVTMADGSSKKIEDIKVGDSVMTFNHKTGEYETQEVFFAYASEKQHEYFTLRFEDGSELKLIGEHDLFEKENRRYVTIRTGKAKEFIGRHFYSVKERKYAELTDVTYSSDATDYYSIYTKHNFNSIADGMLTCPDDADAFLNFYEFDENMVADKEAHEKDVAKYGLREYDASIGMSKKEFEEINGKYINIMKGKGLTTKEKLLKSLAERTK